MSKKLSFCALMSVLGILSIFVANIIPTNTLFFFLLSTLFTYICTEEYGIKYGMLTFLVVALVAYFISSNKLSVLAYTIIVGYYPVLKHIIEHLNIVRPLKLVLKLMFAFVIALVAYLVLGHFFLIEMSVWLLFAVGAVVFIIYDIALTVGIRFYALRLRNFK